MVLLLQCRSGHLVTLDKLLVIIPERTQGKPRLALCTPNKSKLVSRA